MLSLLGREGRGILLELNHIYDALEELSAFITMVADMGVLTDKNLEDIEKVESFIGAYVYRKENC